MAERIRHTHRMHVSMSKAEIEGDPSAGIGNVPTTWSVVQVGDYNGDAKSDILWRGTSGSTAMWFMNGTSVMSTAGVVKTPRTWTVQSTNAE
jgi:hypothetical protein